jgi:hypothetical protein
MIFAFLVKMPMFMVHLWLPKILLLLGLLRSMQSILLLGLVGIMYNRIGITSFNYSLFFVVYFLVFSVCEGSLGLSILVSIIRAQTSTQHSVE